MNTSIKTLATNALKNSSYKSQAYAATAPVTNHINTTGNAIPASKGYTSTMVGAINVSKPNFHIMEFATSADSNSMNTTISATNALKGSFSKTENARFAVLDISMIIPAINAELTRSPSMVHV